MFNVKILDYYNITVHSLECNKLNESIMYGATIKITLVTVLCQIVTDVCEEIAISILHLRSKQT